MAPTSSPTQNPTTLPPTTESPTTDVPSEGPSWIPSGAPSLVPVESRHLEAKEADRQVSKPAFSVSFGGAVKLIYELDSLQNLEGSVAELVMCTPGQQCILDGHNEQLQNAITLTIMGDASGTYLVLFYGDPRIFSGAEALVLISSRSGGDDNAETEEVEGTWSSSSNARTLFFGPVQVGTYCFKHLHLNHLGGLHFLFHSHITATFALSADEILSGKLCVAL
jgi:hypothetical protein